MDALDPTRLVFLDESGAKTNMTPLYGRRFDGERLVDHAPHGHWRTTTVIGALRLEGVGACMTLDGPVDAAAFAAYVKHFLCPTLRQGDLVILDNLSSHHAAGVAQSIEARGASLVWLPPYSPDFNPIEKMWSKTKQCLRKLKARTQEALIQAIAQALQTVTPQDALAWFRSCGYAH
jgi:transposase